MTITTTQAIADKLKALMSRYPQNDDTQQAYENLHQFEDSDWHPVLFEKCLAESPFYMDGDNIQFKASAGITLWQALIQLLAHYNTLIVSPLDEVMGINEAAAYLGLSVISLKKYSADGRLGGRLIGNTKVYTRKILDDFRATLKPAGRPSRASAPSKIAVSEGDPLPIKAIEGHLTAVLDMVDNPKLVGEINLILHKLRNGQYD